MPNPIRRAYRYVLDESAGIGSVARGLRRWVQERANKASRQGNLVMFHAGRCGSSVLADMLNQHPDVRWANEPFEVMKPAYLRMDAGHRARHVIADRMYRQQARFFGFDVKYLPEQHLRPELANKSPAEFVALLESLGFRHYVLLNRRNHLRRAVSVAIGRTTGQWNTAGQVAAKAAVRLDPRRFVSYGKEMPLLAYFQALDATYASVKDCLAPHACLELVYETDVQVDPRTGYRKICQLLGLAPREVQVRLKKMNPQPVSELIENLGEVQTALAGTGYEWMLRE